MTRIIKASEVKPGMTIRWEQGGITYECTVSTVGPAMLGVTVMAWRSASTIYEDTEVTVLSEPAPAQPEEPTAGGARVVVDGRRFLRADNDSLPWVELDVWDWHNWDGLCSLGPVTVVPDQGWEVPVDDKPAPVVPDLIFEWPENDIALRKHKWKDQDSDIWSWDEGRAKWECRNHEGYCRVVSYRPSSGHGPFIRVVDA